MSAGRMLSIFRRKAEPKPDAGPVQSGLSLFLAAAPAVPAVAAPPPPPVLPDMPRPKLSFALDGTGSREASMNAARQLTDTLITAVPGELDVNLAVHGGNRLHTFTPFMSDAGKLRDRAAGIKCKPGYTKLLDILARLLETEGVKVCIYIGDTFEESEGRARKLADALGANGTRLIILHDRGARDFGGEKIFADMAARTGGCVLPFDASSLPKLRELLEAVAVLAVGDVELLTLRQETMPGARLLLEHLKGAK